MIRPRRDHTQGAGDGVDATALPATDRTSGRICQDRQLPAVASAEHRGRGEQCGDAVTEVVMRAALGQPVHHPATPARRATAEAPAAARQNVGHPHHLPRAADVRESGPMGNRNADRNDRCLPWCGAAGQLREVARPTLAPLD